MSEPLRSDTPSRCLWPHYSISYASVSPPVKWGKLFLLLMLLASLQGPGSPPLLNRLAGTSPPGSTRANPQRPPAKGHRGREAAPQIHRDPTSVTLRTGPHLPCPPAPPRGPVLLCRCAQLLTRGPLRSGTRWSLAGGGRPSWPPPSPPCVVPGEGTQHLGPQEVQSGLSGGGRAGQSVPRETGGAGG